MASKNNTAMKFSDEVIAQVAKLLQIAIITGTDIVDNLRMVSVELNSETGLLDLTQEYRDTSNSQIEKLMQEVEAFQPEGE
tara:strand:- start:60 stop:302 length:243 start_codon:yes stop_codon:yes gene_type:complete